MVDDPDLPLRLGLARLEALFEQHLRQVFGDRHVEFTKQLRDRLRELWLLGVETRTGDDMTSREIEQMFRRPLSQMRDDEFVSATRGAMKKVIQDVERGRMPTPDEAAHLAPEALPPPPKRYPATVGTWSPEWPASSERDTTRPACPSCGGRGLGDYPFPCNVCGGSGNA